MSGKQTYVQLAKQYEISTRTVQRYIKSIIVNIHIHSPTSIVLLMDTTYFGRVFGVMLFKDAYTGKNLLKYYVKSETNQKYKEGIEALIAQVFRIKAIVCDGKKGLLQMYPHIPTQMCQFRQNQIIKRYLTKKPKMQASIELWNHTKMLTKTDKESFIGGLDQWYTKWEYFLNERSPKTFNNKSTYLSLIHI